MITKPILLDETGVKIKQAIIRVKNKFLGGDDSAITPGTAGTSGVEPVIQDDTGRDIISALNDLGDIMGQGLPATSTKDILADADAMSDAKAHFYHLAGSFYTGSVPNSLYQYGGGCVIRRASNSIWAIILPASEYAVPIINFNGGSGWLGWKTLVDLIPDASETTAGKVNTGSQHFKGRKGFGYVSKYAHNDNGYATQYPDDVYLYNSDGNTLVAERWYDMGNATNISRGTFYWREYSPKSTPDSSTTGYHENYKLPNVNVGRTTNETYDILTTKLNDSMQNAQNTNFSPAAANTWYEVPNCSFTIPTGGVWAVRALATYNNAQPTGIAISIIADGSQSYTNWSAITDRSLIPNSGTTQYLRASYVGELDAQNVVKVWARYGSGPSSGNNIGLRAYLISPTS